MKRKLVVEEEEEHQRRQQQQQQPPPKEKTASVFNNNSSSHGGGNGAKWLRGPVIGKGSFGSVYLANLKNPKSRYSYLPPVFAVKSAEVSVSATLQKEKEVFNNLQGCPNVLKCFGEEITTADNGDMVYNLLLEHASGGDLGSFIKKSDGGGLPELDVRRYTKAILRGLKHLHESGYVHCDLKPENILLVPNSATSKFVAKIGDLGLAKRAAKQNKKSRLDPYLRGTPLYLSPEVVVDNLQEPPSDIWALGCLVLEMLTGKPAWDKEGDSSSDALLCRIAKEGELPSIPEGIQQEGKGFLKGCFVRKATLRLTAESLLNHPFVAGLDEEIEEEVASDGEEVCSSPSLFEEDDFDFSDSYFSDDCSYFSDEDSLDSSWPGEAEEDLGVKEIAPLPANTTPQCISTFTIPAGA